MTDISTNPRAGLGVGQIMSETFGLVFGNFKTMMILAGVPSAVGVAVNLVIMGRQSQNVAQAFTDPIAFEAANATSTWVTVLLVIFGLLVWAFITSAVTQAAYEAKSGQLPRVGAAFSVALSKLLPVAVMTVLAVIVAYVVIFVVALVVGFPLGFVAGAFGGIVATVAALVAGLWIAARLSAMLPAIVVEDLFFNSFSRSAGLTEGYRWPIVGLLILFFIVAVLISAVNVGISYVGFQGGLPGEVLAMVAGWLVGAFFYALAGAMVALIYARLCEIKEGTSVNALAEVFS